MRQKRIQISASFIKHSLFIFLVLTTVIPAFSSDNIRFYDWESGIVSKGINKKGCYLQFSGLSGKNIFITVHLSMIEEGFLPQGQRAFTLIKITADRGNSVDFSDRSPIEIEKAWIETTSETSLGNIEGMNPGQFPYFLGRQTGLWLFKNLLAGIKKEGMTVRYHRRIGGEKPTVEESRDTETRFRVPAPPREIIEKLRTCLDKTV